LATTTAIFPRLPLLRRLRSISMDWFGRASVDFHAHPEPIALKNRDGNGTTTLLDVVRASVPSCQLNPLLFNGHLQTCWTSVNRTAPPVHYRRKIFEAEHSGYAGSFAVDFYVPPAGPGEQEPPEDATLPPRTTYFGAAELAALEAGGSDDDRPMLVVLHGLSGGSHEVYLRHALAPLLDDGRWEACVINSRGCAMSKITTGILYNARATWDTRQVVRWLRRTYPNRPLFGLGFSLGACILTTVCICMRLPTSRLGHENGSWWEGRVACQVERNVLTIFPVSW
jgi:uncharacterized protein